MISNLGSALGAIGALARFLLIPLIVLFFLLGYIVGVAACGALVAIAG